MLVMESPTGIAGLIAAPVFYAYLKSNSPAQGLLGKPAPRAETSLNHSSIRNAHGQRAMVQYLTLLPLNRRIRLNSKPCSRFTQAANHSTKPFTLVMRIQSARVGAYPDLGLPGSQQVCGPTATSPARRRRCDRHRCEKRHDAPHLSR